MALQRLVRRTAEAAQGTGEAKDALASMGIALRDQDGHLRRSEDLLTDVAGAFARIEDPTERVRLAFKLFHSEGVALVNLLSDGSGALHQMRERARDLGIVLASTSCATLSGPGPSLNGGGKAQIEMRSAVHMPAFLRIRSGSSYCSRRSRR
jgi:hypothetical protein